MNDFYCASPWRGLHINPRGDVKTCCSGDPNMLGNLNQSSIVEILNGDKLKEIRKNLSQGIPHNYCSNCIQAERYGSKSERDWHNSSNLNFDFSTAGELYHYPVIFDVRWNTTCNLSCNYCSDWASSKWANLLNKPFKSGSRPYYTQVCDFIEQHQAHIQEVALVGGEPLLLPENERLLDVIPKDATVTVITNMSVDFENNKIFKKLANRQKVGWSMSFDNIESRFEYVRYGGNWQLLLKNLELIKQLFQNNNHWGGIHAVYNMYNATRLREIKLFAREHNLSILWQNLFYPIQLDPFLHNKEIARLGAQEIEECFSQGLMLDNEKAFFQQALSKYKTIDAIQTSAGNAFAKFLIELESQYHPDKAGQFAQLWPEIYNLL